MARPGLHQHRKFLRLARILESPALARGILEMLWEPAYDAGDDLLGDAEDIAARCGWTGDANFLAGALLDCGFVDEFEDQPGRYRIHDLLDHVPDVVRKRMTREAERLKRGVTLKELRSQAGKKSAEVRQERKTIEFQAPIQQAATNGGQVLPAAQQTSNKRPTNDATHAPALARALALSPVASAPAVESASADPPRAEKPTDPYQQLCDGLFEAFKAKRGSVPEPAKADWAALKRLRGRTKLGDPEIILRWERGLSAEFKLRVDNFRDLDAKWDGLAGADPPGRAGGARQTSFIRAQDVPRDQLAKTGDLTREF